MTRRRAMWIGSAAIVVLVVGIAGWYFLIRDDAPPPLTLESAVTTTTQSTSAAVTSASPVEPSIDPTTNSSVTTAEQTDGSDVPSDPGADGTSDLWLIDQTGTVVGYRIEEELAGIGGNTAVGRTSVVIGTLVLSGTMIESVDVAVDMTTLESDDSRRDAQMQRRGLETNDFPEAAFSLAQPIELGATPAVGEVVRSTAVGTLTLHGVTRSVEVVLEGQFVDESKLVIVGRADVVLSDYDMEPPVGFSVLSVADEGLFEFQLTFTP